MNYTYDLDLQRNRLYVRISGRVVLDDLEKMEGEVEALREDLTKLAPKFDVVTDMVELIGVSEEARQVLHAAMRVVFEAGPRHVIRVIGDCGISDIKAYQFDKTSIGAGYVGRLFKTIEEAEAFLDKAE